MSSPCTDFYFKLTENLSVIYLEELQKFHLKIPEKSIGEVATLLMLSCGNFGPSDHDSESWKAVMSSQNDFYRFVYTIDFQERAWEPVLCGYLLSGRSIKCDPRASPICEGKYQHPGGDPAAGTSIAHSAFLEPCTEIMLHKLCILFKVIIISQKTHNVSSIIHIYSLKTSRLFHNVFSLKII